MTQGFHFQDSTLKHSNMCTKLFTEALFVLVKNIKHQNVYQQEINYNIQAMQELKKIHGESLNIDTERLPSDTIKKKKFQENTEQCPKTK